MARRSAKAARKKDAKRQRAAEKRAERARNRALAPDNSSPLTAGRRLLMLRDAVVKGEAPAPRGLLNLGNTCFFNAVMQNLARIAPFRDYFVGTPPCPGEGPMTKALRAFFVAVWDLNNTSVFDPSNLFTEVGKNNPSFRGRAQQDSHELMRVILDAVIEEEKKRLTNVAKGILPPLVDTDNSDESSEIDNASAKGDGDSSAQSSVTASTTEAKSEAETELEVEPTAGPLPLVGPLPAATADSDTGSLASTVVGPQVADIDTAAKSSSEDESIDDEIPAEKLVTIIEQTVGGMLSSTIECKECGKKSSVTEPFLDLQLPLVSREEAEAKAKVTDTVREKASRAAACLKLRKDGGAKSDVEQKEKGETKEPEKSTVFMAPPPPPPPLPAPPKRPEPVANGLTNMNCDVMRQLRETVIPSEPEPIHENRLILYTGDTVTSQPPTDTEAVFDDDEGSEDCEFLAALFEDDGDDLTDAAVDNANMLNGYSAPEEANNGSNQPSSAAVPTATTSSTPAPRKTFFISSFFGGLGGVSAASHGYRSVVGSLEEFTKVEVLEGDNAYGCEECTRREKLRAALQSKRKLKVMKKKPSCCPTSETERTNALFEVDESGLGISRDDGTPVSVVEDTSLFESDEHVATHVRASSDESQILVSSPVTSSESSSGVSSEDDGELVIEEELENPPANNERLRELTREEEDEIIKQFDVKIPRVRTTAEKRLLLRDAPDVLTLQLKRFTQVGYRGGLRKLSGHVDYPLMLDMTPFVEEKSDKPSSPTEKNKMDNTMRRTRNSHEVSENHEKYEYALTGVVVHGGSLSGGHYTAYVREGVEQNSRGGWYFCNDSKISRASEKDVLNSEAYLLYYERIHV